MLFTVGILLLSLNLISSDPVQFSNGKILSRIRTARIRDASGLAESRIHDGILYTVNDHSHSLQENKVYAIEANTGNLVATITVGGGLNGDWEGLAVGPCPGGSCIFIGDIGEDTEFDKPRNVIYRLREPVQLLTTTIHYMDALEFSWHEPESGCLMVDPTGNAYVISRVRGGHGMMARLPSSGWGGPVVELNALSRLTINTTEHHDPVACDISPDGREMLIKSHDNIFHWSVTNGDYMTAIQTPGTMVPYHVETTGESVAWSKKGDGYYTLGEGSYRSIYYYSKTSTVIVG